MERGGGGGVRWVRKPCQKDSSELKTVIMNHNYFMVNDLDEVVKSVDLEETPALPMNINLAPKAFSLTWEKRGGGRGRGLQGRCVPLTKLS